MSSERASYLHVSEQDLLTDWGRRLYATFHFAHMPYHVGSSLLHSDWRDVDVRVMVPTEVYDQIESVLDVRRLNLMMSLWGQKATGLPIDCQVQTIDEGNEAHGGKRRSALGIDMDRHRHRHNDWEARRG